MSPEETRKDKHRQQKPGFKRTLEGIVERLREGLEELGEDLGRGLRPARPQPIPIPIPALRPRRR